MSTVSVILPSCDSEQWIAQAIDSVLKQSYKDIELIIIDDASNDGTVEIVKRFAADPRVILKVREHCSGGPAIPRNDGLKIATGEYLAFIDSDDIWHPRKLELQLNAMRTHRLNFLSSLHTSFRRLPPNAQAFNQRQATIQRKTHYQLLSKNWVVTSSALISKTLFDDIQFNQSFNYIGVEDYLAWLEMHQREDIESAVLVAPLVFYRVRSDSISSSKKTMAGKVFYLLSHYQYLGKPLGIKKYYFFISYAVLSLLTRLS